jgi:hypothetical protein
MECWAPGLPFATALRAMMDCSNQDTCKLL